MKKIVVKFIFFISFFFNLNASRDDDRKVLSDVCDIVSKMKWSGNHKLSKSHSTLSSSIYFSALIGEDAKMLSGSSESNYTTLEAVVSSKHHYWHFEYNDDGHVFFKDLDVVDSKKFLERIRKAIDAANEENQKKGLPKEIVVGWVQEPTLNKETKIFYWSYEVEKKNNGIFIRTIAFKLGRLGFESISSDIPKESYFVDEFNDVLKLHSFDPGFRYEDYIEGDKINTNPLEEDKSDDSIKTWLFVAAILVAVFYEFRNRLKRKKNGQ